LNICESWHKPYFTEDVRTLSTPTLSSHACPEENPFRAKRRPCGGEPCRSFAGTHGNEDDVPLAVLDSRPQTLFSKTCHYTLRVTHGSYIALENMRMSRYDGTWCKLKVCILTGLPSPRCRLQASTAWMALQCRLFVGRAAGDYFLLHQILHSPLRLAIK
jgi:hypothetical protein